MLIKKILKLERQNVALEAIVAADVSELDPLELDQMIDEGPEEAKDAEEVMHKLSNASTSLEELHELLLDSQNTGGVVPSTAHAVGIALEHIHNTLGLTAPELGVSLEDFSSDARKDSTSIVMESVSETLQKVWKTILEFIDKLIQWCKDLVGDNLGTMKMLSTRADKIKSAMAHVKEFKTIDIEDELLCKRLYSPDIEESKIVPAYNDMLATIANSFSATEQGSISSKINAMQSTIISGKGVINQEKAKEYMLEACDAYAKDVFGNDTTVRKFVPVKSSDTSVVYSTPVVLGGIGWYFVKPTNKYNFSHCSISSYRGEEGSYEQLRSLGDKEIKYVIASFKTMEQIHHSFKKNLEELKLYRSKFNDYVYGTSQRLTGATHEYDPRPSFVEPMIRAMFTLIIGISATSYTHVIKTTRDMFRLCELSLKASEKHEMSSNREMVPA